MRYDDCGDDGASATDPREQTCEVSLPRDGWEALTFLTDLRHGSRASPHQRGETLYALLLAAARSAEDTAPYRLSGGER